MLWWIWIGCFLLPHAAPGAAPSVGAVLPVQPHPAPARSRAFSNTTRQLFSTRSTRKLFHRFTAVSSRFTPFSRFKKCAPPLMEIVIGDSWQVLSSVCATQHLKVTLNQTSVLQICLLNLPQLLCSLFADNQPGRRSWPDQGIPA